LRKVADEAQFLALLRLLEQVAPNAAATILARPHADAMLPAGRPAVEVIPAADLAAVTRALARAELFIMLGGCFMESARQAAACCTLLMIARACRTPVIAVGITAFPYRRSWARSIYSRVFNALDEITVREPAAQQALAALPVHTPISRLADPRYILRPDPGIAVDELLEAAGLSPGEPLVGVTLRHLHDDMPEWVKQAHGYSPAAVECTNAALAAALDALAEEAQLLVLPMHPALDEDLAAAANIRAQMRNPQRLCSDLPPQRTPGLMALVNRCELILASRLAAGMFAVSTATPVFGVAYEGRLQELLTDLGLGAYVMPWLSADPARLEPVARRAWAQRRHIRQELRSAGRSYVESARANAGVIARHLRGSTTSSR
jgi:polysaccharide pyruvyl transferase WcaK-like protein